MKKNLFLWMAGLTVIGSAFFACSGQTTGGLPQGSSSSGGGGSSSGSGLSCLGQDSPTPCLSCIENQCTGQVSDFASGCNAFITCYCAANGLQGQEACDSDLEQGSCETASSALESCEESFCESQCETTTSSSSGGSSTSGSSSSGGFGSSTSGSSSGGPPAGCVANSNVDCPEGDGYECPSGDDPGLESGSSLACSSPVADPDGSGNDFCCFPWVAGPGSCTPDDDLTAECTTFGAFGFQCDSAADDPTSLDSSLNCSAGVADPDGTHTDFCCE